MSNDKVYDDVLAYITQHGETGVNVLAKHCDIPLSTMQRYLEKQNYFRKTVNRKWDIPDNLETDIKSNTMTLMVDSVETALKILDSQLAELQSGVQNALMPVGTLKRAINTTLAPVADTSYKRTPVSNKAVNKMNETTDAIMAIIKRKEADIPEEYIELLKNVDWADLILHKGLDYFSDDLSSSIADIIIKESDKLPDDVVELLEAYQITK